VQVARIVLITMEYTYGPADLSNGIEKGGNSG
jgi:hypothetical protein